MWIIRFSLTLKEAVQFELASEIECEEFKTKCLKSGINANDQYGASYFYPARRINRVMIYKKSS